MPWTCERMFLTYGWRRCGTKMYTHFGRKQCCKMRPCRLDVLRFKANRHQRNAYNRFERYLAGEDIRKCSEEAGESGQNDGMKERVEVAKGWLGEAVEKVFGKWSADVRDLIGFKVNKSCAVKKFGHLSSAFCAAAAAKLLKCGADEVGMLVDCEKTAENIAEVMGNVAEENGAKVVASGKGHLSVFFGDNFEEAAEKPALKKQKLQPHKLEISVESTEFSDEKFEIYSKYQQAVHKDKPEEITQSGFERFLCENPLLKVSIPGGEDMPLGIDKLGAVHFMWRIDGRLVAVEVMDLWPSGFSSVYFMYDPEFEFLNLGTVSVMKDVEILKEMHAKGTVPDMHYLYLGYYIETCPKMAYKGKFFPTEILCHHTQQWVPLEECRPALQREAELETYQPLTTEHPVVPYGREEINRRMALAVLLDFTQGIFHVPLGRILRTGTEFRHCFEEMMRLIPDDVASNAIMLKRR